MVVTVAGEKKTYDEGLTIAKLIEVEKVENPDYVTVSSTGLVTGRKRGITTIYAVVNGVKLGCRVNVTKLK